MEVSWSSTGAPQSLSAIAFGVLATMPINVDVLPPSPERSFPINFDNGNVMLLREGMGGTLSEMASYVLTKPDVYFDFPFQLATVFDDFLTTQRPLEGDVARILAKNLWDLYAT